MKYTHKPKIKTRIAVLCAIAICMLLANTRGVFAQVPPTLRVDCGSGSCTSSPVNGRIFNELDVKPFDTYTRTVEVCNTTDEDLTISLDVSRFIDSDPSLSGVMTLTVVDTNTNSVVFGPKYFEEFVTDDPATPGIDERIVILSGVDNDQCKLYNFIAKMDNVGNEYQNKTMVFDLDLNFEGNVVPTPTAGPTIVPTPTGQVQGEQITITPAPSATPTPTVVPQTLGAQVINTGMAAIIPLFSGIFIVLSGVLFFRNRKTKTQG